MTSQTQEDWTFLEFSTRNYSHGFHLYPARMHPEIAKRLIEKYVPDTKKVVFDPFMGSGGVLVEALLHGNNSIGIDVNPFAVLISRVKTLSIQGGRLEKRFSEIITKARSDYDSGIQYDTSPKSDSLNLTFWYNPDVIKKLEILKHHIFGLDDSKSVIDFFKICFSLTSRKASYQRNSIYKIYRMSQEQMDSFNPDVFSIFVEVCKNNIKKMNDLHSSSKKAKAFPILGDSRNVSEAFSQVPKEILDEGKIHLVVTSPPYGDHQTTVAYGQFSKHPGLWLDLPQEKLFDVDSVGLGGTKKKEVADLDSPLLNKTLKQVDKNDKELSKNKNPTRAKDVYSFFYDLDKCLEQISTVLKPNQSHCCFVVANRTVRRIKIPTDQIIVELGKKHGLKYHDTIYRTIANKAMAVKNAPENIADFTGETMTRESIVIWKY